MPLLVQCVFFFLTTLAIAAWFLLFRLENDVPGGAFLMIVCIGVAEFLIRGYRLWRTGVESALWLGGLFAFIFSLPSSGKPEALLVIGAAAALAGWRVRNALFGTMAMCFAVAYVYEVDKTVVLPFAIAIAVVALFAVTREWRRPSTELLWQILLIVMPIAGYIAARSGWPVFLAFAMLCAAIGIRRRIRIPLVASVVAIALAIIAARLPLALESQLILGGALALAAAAIVARALERRDRGFVLDVPQQSDLEAILSIAPVVAAPHAAVAQQPIGGGGEFGGAGSSGNF